MQAHLVRFGQIEIGGRRYKKDVVIEAGRVRKRKKKASKAYRDRYGHTPLSLDEGIPRGGNQLVVGTGAEGRLSIMPDVLKEARRRGVNLVAMPTKEACRFLGDRPDDQINAVLHVTC